MEQGPDLFDIKLTEQGKKYIRKFVAISLPVIILVIILSIITIYWNIELIRIANSLPGERFGAAFIPYVTIFCNLLAVISNIYYIQFPRKLLKAIEEKDEPGANNAFKMMWKGAIIFLVWLILSVAEMLWAYFSQPY